MLPPVAVYEPEYVPRPVVDTDEPLEIEVLDGVWYVSGKWLERLMANINFSDYESRMYFDKTLRQADVFAQLEARGIKLDDEKLNEIQSEADEHYQEYYDSFYAAVTEKDDAVHAKQTEYTMPTSRLCGACTIRHKILR